MKARDLGDRAFAALPANPIGEAILRLLNGTLELEFTFRLDV
jgi:hypothetical protein